MKIVIICEGRTEKAFEESLRGFLRSRIPREKMPRLKFDMHHGAVPTGSKLAEVVRVLLESGPDPADAVIALTDVYPQYTDANDARAKLRAALPDEKRFHAHVALHDFEAWLLPYWDRIRRLARVNQKPPGPKPEKVNHNNPPAHRLKQLFQSRASRDSYSKPRDAKRILKDADLMIAIDACPELKAFVNTILRLCDPSQTIP